MKKQNLIGMVAVLVFVVIFSGCEQQQNVPVAIDGLAADLQNYDPAPPQVECEPVIWDLTAGQTIVVGSVAVNNDVDNLYITYTLDYSNACFGTLHLWLGDALSNVPSNKKGTPIPGQFPYHFDATGFTTYTFVVPFSDLGIADINDVCG